MTLTSKKLQEGVSPRNLTKQEDIVLGVARRTRRPPESAHGSCSFLLVSVRGLA